MNIAVITGASSGMGRETAIQIDKVFDKGIDCIWLVARRTEKLNELSALLKHSTKVLPFDLTDERDLLEFELALDLVKPNIKILVNASGVGVVGAFTDIDLKEQMSMIRLNCEALTRITYISLKYMKNNSRIINFASASAFVPQLNFSVYSATKSYVLSFSRSLNTELKNRKISVTAVCPGPVKTEFLSLAKKYDAGFDIKKYFVSECSPVVSQALIDAYHRRQISVYSPSMKLFRLMTKLVPHSIILNIMQLMKRN